MHFVSTRRTDSIKEELEKNLEGSQAERERSKRKALRLTLCESSNIRERQGKRERPGGMPGAVRCIFSASVRNLHREKVGETNRFQRKQLSCVQACGTASRLSEAGLTG